MQHKLKVQFLHQKTAPPSCPAGPLKTGYTGVFIYHANYTFLMRKLLFKENNIALTVTQLKILTWGACLVSALATAAVTRADNIDMICFTFLAKMAEVPVFRPCLEKGETRKILVLAKICDCWVLNYFNKLKFDCTKY